MPERSPLPYWLSGGTEQCSDCTHSYVLQMEFRCAWCDRQLCEQCMVIVVETRETICAGCRDEEP